MRLHEPGDLGAVSALVEVGAYDEALTAAQDVVRERAARHGAESIETAEAWNLVGVAAKFAGRFDVARDAYDHALSVVEGVDDPELLATLLHNVGGLAHSEGRFAEGVPHGRRGLAIRESSCGPDDPGIGLDASALAALLEGAGELDEAERLYARAVRILDEHPELAREAALARNGLGSVCQSLERFTEAEHHYREALRQFEKAAGPDHPQIAHILNNLATLHRRRGEDDEARALLARAYAVLMATLGPEHPVTVEVAGNKQRVDSSPSPYV